MTIFKPINENEAQGKVKEVFEDIKSSDSLERTWNSMKQVMKKGAIDEVTKELIYVAVSVSNGCEYCIKSHSAAAIKKGATKQMLSEMIAVTGMANEANRLVEGYQVEIDEKFK